MTTATPLADVLKSQYHASLAMLREAIERCPDTTWYDQTPTNTFWQVAYHTLFFAHLYLQPTEATFVPWVRHQADNQNPDGIPGPPDPASDLPLMRSTSRRRPADFTGTRLTGGRSMNRWMA